MNKYLRTIQLSWQEGLVYRTNLIMWRVRQILATLMSLSLWTVLFAKNSQLFGYSQDQMITYVFVVALLQSVILATSLHGISGYIYRGQLARELLKPIQLLSYFAALDLADKLKNLFFALVESIFLYLIFQPVLTLPSPIFGIIFLIWVLAGAVINFLITLLFGTIGFWSPDAWGPKFLFFMIVDITAGKLFPLDILPKIFQQLIYLTPFPYLSYAQTQLFLGKMSTIDILIGSLGLLFWIFILYLLTTAVWRRGTKNYEATGN